MKKTFSIIAIIFCCIFYNLSCVAYEEILDQTVAVVNDDIISKSEFNHALSLAKVQINQSGAPVPPENVLSKQVLDQLINKKLQLQIAKQAGINVTPQDVDGAVQRVARQNNMTVQTLYQQVNTEGMSSKDYRDEIQEQMTLQKLQQQQIVSRISVTPEEIDRFLRSKAWQNNESKEYKVEDILIPVSETPDSEEISSAKKRGLDVIAKLNQGQSFKQVAQAESGAKNALQGGDLGWRKLPEIPSAFADQIVSMQPKEIAGPIQTSNGFHVIRLVSVRDAATKSSTPTRKQIENLLLQRKFEEAVQNWVSKMRGQAFIVTSPIPA